MACVPGCQICLRLRRSALATVAEAGLEGLSLDAIASRANLTHAEARRHYADAATCIYETYDDVSASIALDMADAFGQGTSWETGYALARQRLLNRMARRPAEARLCFVEVLRGDRQLRLRREQTRQWIVDFLTGQYEQRRTEEGLPEMQIEMLVGAGFQAISTAVSTAEDSATLERWLTELAELLAPVANPTP
jgi:AcrR family transcriptional regulator